jgi:hypothetical protein
VKNRFQSLPFKCNLQRYNVVLLDIAMEKFYRQKVEGMVTANLNPDQKIGLLEYAVRNTCVGGDFERMDAALAFLKKVNSVGQYELNVVVPHVA